MMTTASVTQKTARWPCLSGSTSDAATSLIPLRKAGRAKVTRSQTRRAGLELEKLAEKNPIASKVAKMRALIAVQKRSDVNGDWETIAEMLEAMWGLDSGELSNPQVETPASDLSVEKYAAGCMTAEGTVNLPGHMLDRFNRSDDQHTGRIRETAGIRGALESASSLRGSSLRDGRGFREAVYSRPKLEQPSRG